MKVADVVEIREDGSMLVPSRLRELIGGFDTGTEIWFHPVESIFFEPSSEREKKPIRHNEPKLLMSVINPRIWPFLFEIEMNLGDELGSLRQALKMLADVGISVIIGESRTTLCTVRSEASLIVDLSQFNGTLENLNDTFEQKIRKHRELRQFIKPIEIRIDKEIWIKGNPSPLQDLAIDGKEFAAGRAGQRGVDKIIRLPTRSLYTFVKPEHTIKIPRGLIDKYSDILRRAISGSWAIITASSDTKMLQLTFPKPDAKIVQMLFYVKDGSEPGSLSRLADFLVSKGFNFYESRIRILEFARKELWIVIADIKNSDYREITSEKELEEALRKDILAANRDLGLFDPSNPFKELRIYLPREHKPPQQKGIRVAHFLRAFEPEFRAQIQKQLEKQYEENWWRQGIPPDVREKADARILKEHPKEECSPLGFIEFSDYEKIVLRKDNWRLIFDRIFHDKAWVHTKLSELVGIRNRFAHTREITRDDSRKFKETMKEIMEKFE